MRSGLVLLLFTLFVQTANAAQTIFQFVSTPGDYIGGGQTLVLTPSDVSFSVQNNFFNGVSFFLNNFSKGGSTFWSLDFAAPNHVQLQLGGYPNATRFPFEALTDPGLTIAGDGRGCNQDFGQFTVRDITYDTSGNVSSFAADFEQHCESLTAPALVGAIRYNSDVPVPEIIVASITINEALNFDGCYEATSPAGAVVSAMGSATGSATLALSWSTSTGLTGSGPNFSVPVGLDQSVTLMLTATDTVTGSSSTVSRQLCSTDTTPPTVTILSPTSGASYTHLPKLDVQVTDAVDKMIKQVSVAVGENGVYALDKNGHLDTQLSPRRTIGDMIQTTITVSATDASGNTGQASVTVLLKKGSDD